MIKTITLGIPTWNRAYNLKQLLTEITKQIKEDRLDNIKVLVSDNSSTDETKKICKEFSKYDWFSYVSNKKNIKCIPNVMKVISLCKTDYVWLFGDDDKPLPGKIKAIQKIINREKKQLVVLNAGSSNKTLKYHKRVPEGVYKLDINKKLFEKILPELALLSKMILPVSEAQNIIKKRKKFDNIWGHLELFLLIGQTQKVLFINKQIISTNDECTLIYQESDFLRVFVLGYYDLFNSLYNQTNKKLFKKLKSLGCRRKIGLSSYISISYGNNYKKNREFCAELFRKTKSLKLLILFLILQLPQKINQIVIRQLYIIYAGDKKFRHIKKYYSQKPTKKFRRVSSSENFHDQQIN